MSINVGRVIYVSAYVLPPTLLKGSRVPAKTAWPCGIRKVRRKKKCLSEAPFP